MKRDTKASTNFTQRNITNKVRSISLEILAIVIVGQIDCNGSVLGTIRVTSNQTTRDPILLDPGPVGVIAARQPAVCGYDLPKGRTKRAVDGANEAAGSVLNWTTPAYPLVNVPVSAAGFVAAPVAAAVGAWQAHGERLPQDKLADIESGLAQALTSMAQPDHLRDRIIEAAKAAGRRQFVPLPVSDIAAQGEGDPAPAAAPSVGTVLESRVEELRLERQGKSDSSYALLIKVRVSLSRASSGEIISDEELEYQSGQDLFLDWARNQGTPFQKCADYGYRRLADAIVERMLQATGETPILVGTGNPMQVARAPRTQTVPAAFRAAANLPPGAQFVSQPIAEPGTLYVYPSTKDKLMSIQRPQTKDEAIDDVHAGVAEDLGMLITHPNSIVSGVGIAIAIPVSIIGQTAAILRGSSEEALRSADARVTTATQSNWPAAALARELAQTLRSRGAESVVLLERPRDEGAQVAQVRTADGDLTPVSWQGARSGNASVADKALEIEVLSAALKGNGEVNPSLAVHVEARATLVRGDDGREIYSCPVHYKGRTHKFATWAAKDAKRFREELQRCYRELSNTVIDQLTERGLLAPGENPSLLVASSGH